MARTKRLTRCWRNCAAAWKRAADAWAALCKRPATRRIYATHIESGRRIDLMQDLGACSEGCRLDTTALAEVAGLLAQSIAAAPDLLLVSRFGRAEAEGGGFLTEIGAAAAAGTPTLVGVSAKRAGEWQAFAGEFAEIPALFPGGRARMVAGGCRRKGMSASVNPALLLRDSRLEPD